MKAKLITFVRGLSNGTPPRFLSYLKSLTLILTLLLSVNQAWGADVTYTVSSTTAVTKSGTAPTGASASYEQDFSTKAQMTANSTCTLTLTGYAGYKITGLTINMKKTSGSKTLKITAKAGTTTFVDIPAFNDIPTSAGDKTITLSSTPIVKTGESIVITVKASANSIYAYSYKITYEQAIPATVKWYVAGGEYESGEQIVGAAITFPENPNPEEYSCSGKSFYGWTTDANYSNETTPPTILTANDKVKESGNTFYAVFADASGGGTTSVTKDIIAEAGVSATQTLNATAYQIGDLPIQLTATKGTTNWPVINHNNTKGDDLRFYKSSSSVTFATTNSQPITKIEFKKNATTNSDLSTYFSANVGTLSSNVWTGSANSVTITYNNADANFTEQMYIINVTYTVSNITYSNYTTTCGPSTYTLLFSELLLRYFPAINVTV